MAEITSTDCKVLGAFPNAPANSWSDRLTSQDRDTFRRVHRALKKIGESVAARFNGEFTVATTSGFNETSGVRNTRPKDLWVSLVNKGSDDFVGMPQIYMIASGRGIEIGFAAAIHRADFSNQEVKNKLKAVVPALFDLLPTPNAEVVRTLQPHLSAWGNWHYRERLRQSAGDDYVDASSLLANLHSAEGKARGSGAICRYYEPAALTASVSLLADFEKAARLLAPLMRHVSRLYFSSDETVLVNGLLASLGANETIDEISNFEPSCIVDARLHALKLIVQRQGQTQFRSSLLKAYRGACAITGGSTIATLEAAHIVPYMGSETNMITNGLLLRADIHTLFDFGLVKVRPDYRVWVSDVIDDKQYRRLHNSAISLPKRAGEHPSQTALEWHWENVRLSSR